MADQPKPPCDHGGGESWRFPPMITDPTVWCLDCGASTQAKGAQFIEVPRMTDVELAKLRGVYPNSKMLDAWQAWIGRGWTQ